MGSTIARLMEFDSGDDRIYVLNWVGRARKHPTVAGRFQVFVRFMCESLTKKLDRWVSFETFPFLIVGSKWRKGVMIERPAGVELVELANGQAETWRVPSCTPRPGYVHFDDAYPLAMDTPAAPVLEVLSKEGEIMYLPLSELLRAHYFFQPRVFPSLFGGLADYGHLAGRNLEAWDPENTYLSDGPKRLAHFHRAHFINEYEAIRVARLYFHSAGRKELSRLRMWAEREFAEVSLGSRKEHRADLPRVWLPYKSGIWTVAARRLSPAQDGRARSLVLHIVDFDCPLPYDDLTLTADIPPTEEDKNAPRSGSEGWGKWLEPDHPDPLAIEDGDSASGVRPISLADVLPVDVASKISRPRKSPRLKTEFNRGTTRSKIATGTGSVLGPGSDGTGRTPTTMRDGELWPERTQAMVDLTEMVEKALMTLLLAHQRLGMQAHCRPLPDRQHVYSFIVPKSETEFAKSRVCTRQFLVFEVRLDNRFVYLIEPQRRLESDSFPLGVWGTRQSSKTPPTYVAMNDREFELIAQRFETAQRYSVSWLRLGGLEDQFVAGRVTHPPQKSPTDSEIEGFKRRIANAVMTMIGDVRVLAESA